VLPLSARPYLVRAIYDWCVAEGHTPYVLAATTIPGVRVPKGYERDGRITLNIGPRAVQSLDLGPDRIRFSARFGNQQQMVEVPLKALVAIFAAETHDGMVFGEPEPHRTEAPAAENGPDGAATPQPATAGKPSDPQLDREQPDPDAPPPRPGPRLRLVK